MAKALGMLFAAHRRSVICSFAHGSKIVGFAGSGLVVVVILRRPRTCALAGVNFDI